MNEFNSLSCDVLVDYIVGFRDDMTAIYSANNGVTEEWKSLANLRHKFEFELERRLHDINLCSEAYAARKRLYG